MITDRKVDLMVSSFDKSLCGQLVSTTPDTVMFFISECGYGYNTHLFRRELHRSGSSYIQTVYSGER